MDIYHLYHGSRENRQYAERHKMLNIQGEIEDYIKENEEGVFEWKEPEKWNPLYLQYFKKRDDDSLSDSEVKIQVKSTS